MHNCVSAPTDTRHRTTTGDRQIDSVHDAGDRMLGGRGYRDAVHGKSQVFSYLARCPFLCLCLYAMLVFIIIVEVCRAHYFAHL
jgi:hypothetical protein